MLTMSARGHLHVAARVDETCLTDQYGRIKITVKNDGKITAFDLLYTVCTQSLSYCISVANYRSIWSITQQRIKVLSDEKIQ